MTMKKCLTLKQQLFVQNYLIDLNATQAAIRSGYSKKTAYSIGFENLKKPEIAKAIQESANKRMKSLEIDARYVLEGSKELFERCMQHEPVRDHEGNETGEYKFDSSGAGRALKLIGDHTTVNAFNNRLELEAGKELLDFLDSLKPTTGPPSER